MSPSPLVAALERIERSVPPDQPFLVGVRPLGYGELFERARRLAAFFQAFGLAPGSRVLVSDAACCAVPELLVAGLRCGVGLVVANPAAPPGDCGVALSFADRPVEGAAVSLSASGWLRRLLSPSAVPTLADVLAAYAPLSDWPEPPGEDLTACVLFTAGTHAAPRPVTTSHAALAAAIGDVARTLAIGPQSRLLNPLPLHHAGGLVHGLLAALLAGGTLLRPATLALPAEWVRRHAATHVIATPAQFVRLLSADAHLLRTGTLRFLASLGGALDEEVWRALEARFGVGVVNLYGPAETLGAAFAAAPGTCHRFATVGRALRRSWRIVDEQGRPAAVGAVGELHLDSGPEAGGWMPTGDLATADADGFVALIGRAATALGRGNRRIHPERTAAALRAHPDVEAATAFADGAGLTACVALRRPVRPDALLEHLRARLPKPYLPDRLRVLDGLPRDSLGAPSPHTLRGDVPEAAVCREGVPDDRLVR